MATALTEKEDKEEAVTTNAAAVWAAASVEDSVEALAVASVVEECSNQRLYSSHPM